MAAKIPKVRIGEIMKVVLTELKNAGGEAKLKNLFERSEPKLNRLCAGRNTTSATRSLMSSLLPHS